MMLQYKEIVLTRRDVRVDANLLIRAGSPCRAHVALELLPYLPDIPGTKRTHLIRRVLGC